MKTANMMLVFKNYNAVIFCEPEKLIVTNLDITLYQSAHTVKFSTT